MYFEIAIQVRNQNFCLKKSSEFLVSWKDSCNYMKIHKYISLDGI